MGSSLRAGLVGSETKFWGVHFVGWTAWLAIVAPLVADDWPQWRGPTRSGVSAESDWSSSWSVSGPKILWQRQLGIGFSSIVVAEGRLLSMGNQDDMESLICFDSLTGEERWRHSYEAAIDDRDFEGGPTSTPTIDGEHVYMVSRTGDVACLRVADGTLVWQKNLVNDGGLEVPGWGFSSSPVIRGDQLILNAGQSGTALDKHTGEILWQSEREAGYMTPLWVTIGAEHQIVVASGKFYQGVKPETGEVLWRHRWLTSFGCNASDPILHENKLFFSSGYNRGATVLDLSQNPPTVVWESKEFQNQWSSSILLDGHLYGVDGNDTGEQLLKCVNFHTGEVCWSQPGYGAASLIASDGKLLVLGDEGTLTVAPATPKGFTPIASNSILTGKCWTPPTLVNGLLYARNAAGDLVCVDLRNR